MFAVLDFAGLVRLEAGLRILGRTEIAVGSSYELRETVGGQCAGGAGLLRGGLLLSIALSAGK